MPYTATKILLVTFVLVISCTADIGGRKLTYKYYVSTDMQNWFGALINCKSAGMELVSIPTEADQKNLERFMSQNGHHAGYWTSGTNLGNGNYYWASTGSSVVYSTWLGNQPDNALLPENDHKGENCIQWGIYHSSPNPIAWNDLGCTYKLRYICQEVVTCE